MVISIYSIWQLCHSASKNYEKTALTCTQDCLAGCLVSSGFLVMHTCCFVWISLPFHSSFHFNMLLFKLSCHQKSRPTFFFFQKWQPKQKLMLYIHGSDSSQHSAGYLWQMFCILIHGNYQWLPVNVHEALSWIVGKVPVSDGFPKFIKELHQIELKHTQILRQKCCLIFACQI